VPRTKLLLLEGLRQEPTRSCGQRRQPYDAITHVRTLSDAEEGVRLTAS